ncbi:MAG: hypothetical protein V4805_11245 [Pseudomonadota bacterium]
MQQSKSFGVQQVWGNISAAAIVGFHNRSAFVKSISFVVPLGLRAKLCRPVLAGRREDLAGFVNALVRDNLLGDKAYPYALQTDKKFFLLLHITINQGKIKVLFYFRIEGNQSHALSLDNAICHPCSQARVAMAIAVGIDPAIYFDTFLAIVGSAAVREQPAARTDGGRYARAGTGDSLSA